MSNGKHSHQLLYISKRLCDHRNSKRIAKRGLKYSKQLVGTVCNRNAYFCEIKMKIILIDI